MAAAAPYNKTTDTRNKLEQRFNKALRELNKIDNEKFQMCMARKFKVIALDFPLEFAGFFPREKSGKTREISCTFRKKSGKNTGFSPRYSAPKRHSSLFLRTF